MTQKKRKKNINYSYKPPRNVLVHNLAESMTIRGIHLPYEKTTLILHKKLCSTTTPFPSLYKQPTPSMFNLDSRSLLCCNLNSPCSLSNPPPRSRFKLGGSPLVWVNASHKPPAYKPYLGWAARLNQCWSGRWVGPKSGPGLGGLGLGWVV